MSDIRAIGSFALAGLALVGAVVLYALSKDQAAAVLTGVVTTFGAGGFGLASTLKTPDDTLPPIIVPAVTTLAPPVPSGPVVAP